MDLSIYDIWGILLWGIIILIFIIVLFPIYNFFKNSKGKSRRISGEVLRDIGISILVGGAFKFEISELAYYVTLLLGGLLIVFGVIMKEDKR